MIQKETDGGFSLTGKTKELYLLWEQVFEKAEAPFLFAGIPSGKVDVGQHYTTLNKKMDVAVNTLLNKLSAGNAFNRFSIVFAAINHVIGQFTATDNVVVATPWLAYPDEEVDDYRVMAIAHFKEKRGTLREFVLGFREKLLQQYGLQSSWEAFEVYLKRYALGGTNVFCFSPQVHTSVSPEVRYDLCIEVDCSDYGTALKLVYDDAIYESGLIEHFWLCLEHFISKYADMGIQLHEATLLTGPKSKLSPENSLKKKDLEGITLVEIFEAWTKKTPLATAIIYKGQEYTYRDISLKTNHIAKLLCADYQFLKGDVAGVLVPRSELSVIAMLAIMKSGGIYLPISFEANHARVSRAVKDTAMKVVLMHSEVYSHLPQLEGVATVIIDFQKNDRPRDKDVILPQIDPKSSAYIIFTSGSSGQPKGVEVSHESILNTILWRKSYYDFDSSHSHLLLFSPAFDGSLTAIFSPLLSGGRLVIPEEGQHADPQYLGQLISTYKVNHFITVPTFYTVLLSEIVPFLQDLLWVTLAGESVKKGLVQLHYEAFPHIPLYNEYGPTENAVCSTCGHLELGEDITIGRPIDNVTAYIIDNKSRLMPQGAVGELCLSGTNLAKGYWKDEKLTGQKFVTATFLGREELMYKTGDKARIAENGQIEYFGRIDNQLKVKGYRIEPEEIEHCILRLGGVKEVAVVGKGKNSRLSLVAYFSKVKKISLFPSLAEYILYDDILYHTMANDRNRNKKYREAIKRMVEGKVVLEVGPGAEAILSLLCIEYGATKVYAVEILEDAYLKAKEKVKSLGLEEKVIIMHGDILEAVLPEKVDCCVSEIVGAIGGSEGAAKLIDSVRKWVKDPSQMIPARSVTRVAGAYLPEEEFDYSFSEIGAHYVESIFSNLGRRFDLRLCLEAFDKRNIISTDDIFEDLDFTHSLELEGKHNIDLEVNQDGFISGLVVWLTLFCDEEAIIDVMEERLIWLPIYFPIFSQAQPVKKGDRIKAEVTRVLSDNGLNPDYILTGHLIYEEGLEVPFHYVSANASNTYKGNDFYRKVFANDSLGITAPMEPLKMRKQLEQWLPGYMIPSRFIELEKLPRMLSGKLDRKALSSMEELQLVSMDEQEAPRSTVEETLLEVWQEVLDTSAVGIHSDFFSVGGDSIRAIQITSKMRGRGYKMEIKDLLKLKKISKISPFVRRTEYVADQGLIEGVVPLTPIQAQFFDTVHVDLFHYNQAVVLFSKDRFKKLILERVLDHLIMHHDALRMTFTFKDDDIIQQNQGLIFQPTIEEFEPYDIAEFNKVSNQFQKSMVLEKGPLIRMVLFRSEEGDRLVIIAHHLVIDGVSWRILLEDIHTLYQQHLKNLPLRLPLKTDAYRHWANTLIAQADKGAFDSELPYWKQVVDVDFTSLPTDYPVEDNDACDTTKLFFQLEEEKTVLLLTGFHEKFDTEMNDVLLTALAISIESTFGLTKILVELEGHGREGMEDQVDIDRTVGWFTIVFPFLLEKKGADLLAQLAHIKAGLRQVPNKGMGYGVLRYLTEQGTALGYDAAILFNYLGQFDTGREEGLFVLTGESAGDVRSNQEVRRHLLVMNGLISEGCLKFSVEFNTKHFEKATMEGFCKNYLSSMEALLLLCENRAEDMPGEGEFYFNELSSDDLNTLFD